MSKTTDKLIDEIIELVLEDMDCHHEVDHEEDGVHTSVEYNLNDETKLREKIGELIEQSKEIIQRIGKDWLPTVENVNALPEPVRNYIADIGTNADPPSMVADNIIMKDTIKTLEKILEERPAVDEGFVNIWAKEIIPKTIHIAKNSHIKEIVGKLERMLNEAGIEVIKI